ncbi:MAG: SDR family NAD(P)-dependent oxidoreductase, partial [Zoogloea sp.]|nr:SDR family NAD(P)-dependent oxidoreductase [Zoogloea sp.]
MQASVVALVRNTSYQAEALRQSVEHALALIGQPLSRLIRPGDRVLVKPYLRHGPMRAPETRMVSHPALIEALIGMVRDCGGHPLLGDEGSRHLRRTQPPPDEMWFHLLAERAGAELVSFAKAGGRLVPSGIPRPGHYLLSRAVLDADVVINLANAVLHPTFVWSGAVKNMFNAVVGAGNAQLFELLREHDALNAAVADLCRLARPTLSLSDMTTVCPDSKADLWRVGLIGASTDPVALDSASVQALGWDPGQIGSLVWGQRLGLGQWARQDIDLRGLSWAELPVFAQAPRTATAIAAESRVQRTLRIVNKTTLRPRPIIDGERCTGCTDCIRICPIGAIAAAPHGRPLIEYARCVDCMVCADACGEQAIRPGMRGWPAAALWPLQLARKAWRRSKTGYVWHVGNVSIRLQFKKTKPVRKPRPAAPPGITRKEGHMQASSNPQGTGGVALIVGVGPGLGTSLARRFAREGMDIALVARDGHRLEALVAELESLGVAARIYPCDITEDPAVTATVRAVCSELDVPRLAVYCTEHFGPGHVVDIETSAFVDCWEVNCLGAFLVGREVARAMLTRGAGTLIFTGATAAMRGREGYANMAVGKWGQRALAQCMARELGPKGIHVAHVIIDGG